MDDPQRGVPGETGTGGGGPAAAEDPSERVGFLAETAARAPSVHNTQPWWFGFRGSRVSLHADVDRKLNVADPDGREMLISCGAALLTLRLAARHLGYVPEVTLLPDADRPNLVADLYLERRAPVSEEERRLYRQIRRRRAHRGAFGLSTLPPAVLSRLRAQAQAEGAMLRLVADDPARKALAALTEAAEYVQRMDPAYDAELARWSFGPESRRDEGVHPDSYPRHPRPTDADFPMRDFARGRGWGTVSADAPGRDGGSPAQIGRSVTGVVAVLTTGRDVRPDWVRAGQALQRVLLDATAHGAAAAFHTQALEVPELREFIRRRFCDGGYPQMVLRLGIPPAGADEARGAGAATGEDAPPKRRRPPAEIVEPEA